MKKTKELTTGNIIIPYNPKKYDLERALELFPYIEWSQHCRPEIGGSVYLYIGKSGGKDHSQQLAYEFEVLDTDVKATIDDSCCTKGTTRFSQAGKFIKTKLIRRIPSNKITLDGLLSHGLSKHPQSQMKVSFEIQRYIDSLLG